MVWARLSLAVKQADVVSLATVSVAGGPEVRSVVLRDAEPETGVVKIYTDLQSDKIASLKKTPRAEVLLWDATLKLQIRATCVATILTGDTLQARWDAMAPHSRLNYGSIPAPGQEIADSTAYEKVPAQAVFAILSCRVDAIDAVHLGHPHRRASFARSSSNNGDWDANWLAP